MKKEYVLVLTLAAVAATTSATFPSPECSSQGVVYPDVGVCECFNCFSGPNCSVSTAATCTVNAVGGSPLMYQEYWATVDKPTVTLDSWYRTGYQFESVLTPASTGIGGALFSAISDLHRQVGNVNPDGMSLVVGSGATLLIAASSVATAAAAPCDRPIVFARPPYYDGYAAWASLGAANVSFSGSLDLDPDAECITEYVTVPNNPTGEHRSSFYAGRTAHVHDMVYNWPSLTKTTVNASHDIMLFSLSKLSGHAGSRIGWAWVRDPAVAAAMESFVSKAEITTSIDSRYRALEVVRAITASNGAFFADIRSEITARWNAILPLFANHPRFAIESVPNQFYLWIHCLQDANCYDVFYAAGIEGWAGPAFGASPTYVRLELVQHSLVFSILLDKLHALLA